VIRDWSNFIAGRTALVTGSGGGVGRAIAIQMARAGAELRINDIHLDRAEKVCREIEEEGGVATPVVADVSDRDQVARMVDDTGPCDILVNNAGIPAEGIVIKSFVREEYERDKQYQLQQALVRAQLKQRKTNYAFDAMKTFAEQVGVTLIIILTAYLVLDQQMTIGAIMFHILLFNNVSAPIRQLHRIYDQMNEALTYAEGFFEILDADDAIEESGELTTDALNGEFVLKNVDFIYPNGTQALWDVNMTIPAGKTVAFVGLSGAGKSTLLNLLCKFYAPTRGEIFLDGHDRSLARQRDPRGCHRQSHQSRRRL